VVRRQLEGQVDVVHVHGLDLVVRVRRGPLALAAQLVEAARPDEPRQHAAPHVGQLTPDPADHVPPGGRVGERVPVGVDDADYASRIGRVCWGRRCGSGSATSTFCMVAADPADPPLWTQS